MRLEKLLASVTSAAMAVTCLGGGLSEITSRINLTSEPIIAEAATYSEDISYGDYLTIQKVDQDEDGAYDYIEIDDCDTSATSIEIPSEIDGLPVTSIIDYAFEYCTSLESITIPDSVTSIGYSAFYNTPWLKAKQSENPLVIVNDILIDGKTCKGDVIIPDSVISIGSYAFNNCTNLESITIPDSVTSIGRNAFSGCSLLTSITIPDSVISIGRYTFNNCTNLESVTIGNSVTSIGDGAFYACYDLTSITIPDSVTSIGDSAFYNCDGLTSITIPDSVTSIGDSAFYYCDGLTSITIPDSVTSIGDSAFYNCDGLTSITIPDSVTSIGNNAFADTPWLEAKQSENPLVIVNGILIDGKTCKGNVIIPNSVTIIGEYAFEGCTSLTSVTLFDSVTSIGYMAFFGCTNLENVYITDIGTWCNIEFGDSYSNPLYYANNLYLNNELITDLFIPDGVTQVPAYGFSCQNITNVTIPESVTSIGINAFADTPWLEAKQSENPLVIVNGILIDGTTCEGNVIIPDSVTSIGNYAFLDCTSLESITIPDSVTSIGNYAFQGCTSLSSITIPDSVTSIGRCAFEGSKSLEDVYITDITTWCSIDFDYYNFYYIFDYTSNPLYYADNLYLNNELITDLFIPDGVTQVPAYGFSCQNITNVTIPDSVTSIGSRAFSSCTSIESVTIGNSVTSIGNSAFLNCTSLASITIPDSVISIDNYAFKNCTSLENVYITDIGAWCNIEFGNNDSNPLCYADNLYLNNELITELIIPDGVTQVPTYGFSCQSITNVTIPDSVTSIGSYAFEGCIIKELIIADGRETITSNIIVCKNTLETIIIPDSVTSIEDDSFYDCTNLQNVYITDIAAWCNIEFGNSYSNPLYYANNLYLNNELITELVIPDGVTQVPAYGFSCQNTTNVTIPDSVTSIGSSAFRGCSGIAYITIPDSVKYIGADAFADTALLKVQSGVKYADNWIVDCDTDVTEIEFKEETRGIAEKAFANCTSITDVTIPDSVLYMNNNAFSGCKSLKTLVIGNGISVIPEKLFNGFTSLTNLTIGENVESIGTSAFSGCTSITDIVIPDNVVSINDSAFSNCSSLKSISFGKNISEVAENAFLGCTKLSAINVSEENQNYSVIDNVLLNKKQNAIVLYPSGKSDTQYIISDNVTEIKPYAFYKTSNLEELVIFENATTFGEKAISSMASDFAIHGVIDSAAHTYATNNNISFNKSPMLNKTDIQIMPGQNYLLELKNVTDTVVWVSNDRDVATVENGNVSAVALGETVVNAVLGDDVYKCNVTVLETLATTPVVTTAPSETTTTTTETEVVTTEPSNTTTNSAVTTISDVPIITTTKTITTTESTTTESVDYLEIKENNGTIVIVDCETLVVNVVVPESIDDKIVSKINDYAFSSEDIETITFNNPDVEIADSATTINEDAVIYGYWESTAHDYAIKYNREFVSLDVEPDYVQGDITGDGNINLYDAIDICKYIMGMKTLTEEEQSIADYNGDGKVDLYDAIGIAKKLLE